MSSDQSFEQMSAMADSNPARQDFHRPFKELTSAKMMKPKRGHYYCDLVSELVLSNFPIL